MQINKVFSIIADVDDALLIDMDYIGLEGRVRSTVAYRSSDPYSPLTPVITQWLADNNPEILPYAPPAEPTPEELRAQMPSITKRQLRLTLVRNGISLETVEATIAAMPDGLVRQEAQIEWQDASEFTRMHSTLLLVASMLSLNPEQVDTMWREAMAI